MNAPIGIIIIIKTLKKTVLSKTLSTKLFVLFKYT